MAANKQEECLRILGVKAFHEAGYTGTRAKIMSGEKVYKADYPDVISPAGFQSPSGSWHGNCVMTYITLIAPDATRIGYPMGGSFSTKSYKSACLQYIIDEKVHVFTSSQLGTYSQGKANALQDVINKAGTVFCCAAGNKGNNGLLGESKIEQYLAIGGVDYEPYKDPSKFKKVSYSSVGKELDYVTIAEIPTKPEYDTGAIGTSFCSPVFAGMLALLQDFFIDKTGKPLAHNMVYKFIADNCIDVEKEGFDTNTGNGLFVLPDPATIDIKKYCPDYQEEAKEEPTKPEPTPVEPEKQPESTPVEPEKPQEPTKEPENNSNDTIVLTIDSKVMMVGDKKVEMDTAPFIKDSRTFVPVAFIAKELGREVIWDGNKRTVTIK